MYLTAERVMSYRAFSGVRNEHFAVYIDNPPYHKRTSMNKTEFLIAVALPGRVDADFLCAPSCFSFSDRRSD